MDDETVSAYPDQASGVGYQASGIKNLLCR